MKTCETCLFWRRMGHCPTPRRIVYDNRVETVAPGDEGQCRALPPAADNRWPLTMAGDWCGCHTAIEAEQNAAPIAANNLESATGGTPRPGGEPAAQSPAQAAPLPTPSPSLLARLTRRHNSNPTPQ